MSGGVWQAVRLTETRRPCDGTVIAEGPSRDCVLPHWSPGVVAICWRADAPPVRRLSAEALASVRRKRVLARLDRKLPLLAAVLFEADLEARPGYFAGERGA